MEMRRKDRRLPVETAKEMLKSYEWGILGLVSPENTAYAVPINYVYSEGENAIYMHGAKVGRKLSCIRHNPNVSFTIASQFKIMEKEMTTIYESVIVEGTASILEDKEEKAKALRELCLRLCPSLSNEEIDAGINKGAETVNHTGVIKIDIKEIAGKANRGKA